MRADKLLAAALLSLVMTGNVFAADLSTGEKDGETTLMGEICEFETGNIYKMRDEAGNVTRVDLGKYSGRMLNRTPFRVTGKMTRDEKGPFLKMRSMEYKDPDPFAEYFAALQKTKNLQKGGLELEQVRDPAFDHENPVSDDPVVYKNNVKKLSEAQLKEYEEKDAQEFANLDKGTKVVFKGRAIQTVIDRQVMLFWDAKGNPVRVQMNGAYCPLGQRCFIYGTWEPGESGPYLSLDYMESLELPAEAYPAQR